MTKRNIFYVLGIIVIPIIIGTILFLSSLKYSMMEITADNYIRKLKQSDGDLRTINFNDCIPDNFELDLSIHRGESDYGSFKITKDSADGVQFVDFISNSSGLRYRMGWKNGAFITCYIGTALPNNKEYFYEVFKGILDKLILTQGFILKESTLKNGRDILIKETDSDYIIARFFFQYSTKKITSIFISSYSKKKFF